MGNNTDPADWWKNWAASWKSADPADWWKN
jgi:hypothetical protein